MYQDKADADFSNEVLLSLHSDEQWRRRKRELISWTSSPKVRKGEKKTRLFNGVYVDSEIYPALSRLNRLGIQTEFSCAGVSPLDEPVDHSLYAYITLMAGSTSDKFAATVVNVMKHRVLVTFEPTWGRYDVSSFFIGHNRSFCLLIDHCAALMEENDSDV
ncbi:hypothetical protein SAMN05661091_2378 [Paenibacillus uliginis N3/975]|uniref:Uncharacterized protein n=1 Tax=Paenibacillus uliginis N3/975 TaxID=1313296 RepID=A0A1X7HDB8_9BACL|nr:hypothetical protein [Paenibacillus uliginis]SMF83427.1 hypothetical protein SAMN05661091_2378 [Paenibacillus uliginis N3/975]